MRRNPVSPELRAWIEDVVDDNADDILRYLRRRVNQSEDAADLLGRVLLALWENSARMPTTAQEARMWCFGIARNIVREHYRNAAKRLAIADGLRDHLRSSAQQDNAADTTAETRMRAEKVRQALTFLDERSRELVMLVHWDGFSIAEAARILSINQSTARTLHGRALQRLEKHLDDRPLPSGARRKHTQPGFTTGSNR
jgi:RNA polymerase sigma-70 factor (ECF subfamily)